MPGQCEPHRKMAPADAAPARRRYRCAWGEFLFSERRRPVFTSLLRAQSSCRTRLPAAFPAGNSLARPAFGRPRPWACGALMLGRAMSKLD